MKDVKMDKKKRELEIAANFEKVINHLPVDFFNAFINTILGYKNEINSNQIGTYRERAIFNDQRRVDLELCLFTSYSKIIFEFKLGKENFEQVKGYAKTAEKALVVSVAKEILTSESDKNIVQLTWTDLFNGLLKVSSSEVRERLIPLDSSTNFSPDFPDRRLGEPALSFLEDFLFTVRDQKLVSFKGNRVMVVAGEMATNTSKNHDLYWFGQNWDKDFQYLVVVNNSVIQYVGEVIERYFGLDELNEISDKDHRNLIVMTFNEESHRDQFVGQSIVLLKPINDEMIGKRFVQRGAITQSHRYFENLKKVFEQFNS